MDTKGDDIRARFTSNAKEFDALMVEMLAENKALQIKVDLMCKVIDKVGVLASIELNEEVDRVDATEDLFKAWDNLQKSCDVAKVKDKPCYCGKKLRGIERA